MNKCLYLWGAGLCLLATITSCKSLNKTQADTGRNNAGLSNILADFRTNNTMAGALMDGVLAGDAGVIVNKKIDDEATQIEKLIPGSQVKHVGEGLNISFDSGFVFARNSAKIEGTTKENLDKLVPFFTSNPNTKILIEGHTATNANAKLSEDKSKKLAQQRAIAVSRYFQSKGILANRITEKWYGSGQPKIANDTEQNTAKNRRVEIGLIPEEQYKKLVQESKVK